MVYFISDLHLGHENIIKYCSRPFVNVNEMNEALIENWNKCVNRNDKIFVLGDFALSNREDIVKWGRALRGNKVLILGNHDRASRKTYYEAGFSEVIKYPILWNGYHLLSHSPIELSKDLINIYGHVHNMGETTDTKACVSVEMIDYKPISFIDLYKLLQSKDVQLINKFYVIRIVAGI